MSAKRNRLLPPLLVRERARAGMSQKQLALQAGLVQSSVCAVEKGHRPNLGPLLIGKLRAALQLDEAQSRDLFMAAEHDRIVAEAERGCLASSAALVSAAILAGHYLEADEREGLALKIHRSIESKTHLLDLRTEAAAAGEGGVAMA